MIEDQSANVMQHIALDARQKKLQHAQIRITWPTFPCTCKFGADRQRWVMVGRQHPIHDVTSTEVKLTTNSNASWPREILLVDVNV